VDRTNAERQRRYIAKLKGREQETIALRQKVTMLKQELAQQRAMAKEGLRMKALKAAPIKLNGGVVGFHDANLEFHEALCLPSHPLPILSWVLEEAQPAIEELWKAALPDKEVRTALERLATDRRMRGVWQKLRDVEGVAQIIPLAIEAFTMFALLRPPPQSKRREAWQRYQQHLDKLWINHPHPTRGLLTCAAAATDLRYALESLRTVLAPIGDELWSRYWRGDSAMNSMGAAIGFLTALQGCFITIDDKQRSVVKRFPSITRWDKRARQRFFAQVMSNKMRELCKRPRHDIVAVLVCVAFDVDDVDTKTVREWCRKTG
jgi:hypothetical protein